MSATPIGRREFLANGASVAGTAVLGASIASCFSDRTVAPNLSPPTGNATIGNHMVNQANASVLVYPTGIYPNDVENVQSALDIVPDNGTVVLKAVDELGEPQFFNFGDDTIGRGDVIALKDVVICGEPMPPRAFVFPSGLTPEAGWTPNRTVIYGGRRPIHCIALNPVATTLAVRGIYFAYPALNVVQVKKSAGLEVSDCVVYNMKRAPAPGVGLVVAIAFEASGLALANPELYGEFNIFNNAIKRREDLDYGPVDTGVVLQLSTMTVHIHHNRVVGFGYAGIGIDANGAGGYIEDNEVMACGYGVSPQSCGIGTRTMSPGPAREAVEVVIRRNEIIGGSVAGAGGTRLNSKNGIGLLGSSNVTVTENVIRGTVRSDGILVAPIVTVGQPSLPSRQNVIKRNDLTSLVAGHAQALLDTACDENQSIANDFGQVDLSGSGVAGILVRSSGNELRNDSFWGNYPGTSGSPPLPCVWLAAGSHGNQVAALKLGAGAPAFDLCTQIRNDDPANSIPGYEACAHAKPQIVGL